ncbi:MAG: EamA family transporter [Patescibacteria group bacterium]
MSWIIVALLAYSLLAIANLIDKFLIDNVLPSSKAYTFLICLMGLVVFAVAPWFLKWPGIFPFLLNILVGFVFAIALYFLYESLRRGEASRVLVFIGGMTPVFSLLFSVLFFKEHFTDNQWLGMIIILIGVLIIAFLPKSRTYLTRILKKAKIEQKSFSNALLFALLSALAYSLYFIISKYTYSFQPFLSAFIWSRLGAAIFVFLFLIRRSDRKQIRSAINKKNPNQNKLLVLLNQGFGSVGFMLQNYAIFLGAVALVNALQGFQYAFLLLISTVLAIMSPKLLKETFSWRIVLQKGLAIIIVGLGIYFLTI